MNEASVEPRPRGRSRRVKAAVAVAATALVPATLSTAPAEGTVVKMDAAHNITVFHNIDFVAVTGYAEGELLTVEVQRGGNIIGTATGAARGDAVEGFGLEVNHGPEGAPLAGDCWEGNVPNIRPNDVIRVTSDSSDDKVRSTRSGSPDSPRRSRVATSSSRSLRSGPTATRSRRRSSTPPSSGPPPTARSASRETSSSNGGRVRCRASFGCATTSRSVRPATGQGGTRPSFGGPCWATDTQSASATSTPCPWRECSSTA